MTLTKAQVSWVDDVAPDAVTAAEQTGVNPFVILAQWAVETGYGTDQKNWVRGHNYAGVSPGGQVASYPDRAHGLASYIHELNSSYYADVRNAGATHPEAQLDALAKSPWASGHYRDRAGVVGGSLRSASGEIVNAPLPDVLSKWEPGVLGQATPINPPDVAGAVGGALSSAIGGLAAPFARIAFTGTFLIAGLGLVVLGVWRTVQPVRDRARDAAEPIAQAAAVGAMA